jgi:hypothetical protein
MSLVEKYNVAGPRYTSYPTVPYWNTKKFSVKAWKNSLVKSFEESVIIARILKSSLKKKTQIK